MIGLEPTLLTEPEPKSGASANFATSADIPSLMIARFFINWQALASNLGNFFWAGFVVQSWKQKAGSAKSFFLFLRLTPARRLTNLFYI